MGTNTDPYQRAEGKYRLTRGIVEVLASAANPFSILTKSTLVLRDLALLAELARRTAVRLNLSIRAPSTRTCGGPPGHPHPARRVRGVEALNAAGVLCGVLVAPVLPGLSDGPDQLEAVVKACVEARARFGVDGAAPAAGVGEAFLSGWRTPTPTWWPTSPALLRPGLRPGDADQRAQQPLRWPAGGRHGGTPAEGTTPTW